MANVERLSEETTSTEADWQVHLKELLQARVSDRKIALVGVGHPLRGDDYVGSYVAKAIIEQTDGILPETVFVFDAEGEVESLIIRLADLAPSHVVFIDACDMRSKPGQVNIFPIAQTSYPFFTTHGIPLKVLSERLLPKSDVWALAIQPKQIELGAGMSREVRGAAASISKLIMEILAEMDRPIAD